MSRGAVWSVVLSAAKDLILAGRQAGPSRSLRTTRKSFAFGSGRHLLAAACLVAVAACHPAKEAPTFFEALAPSATGVTFVNRLPEDTTFNILNYLYYYNGGGVAAGDVNGDGLPDLYFTANLGPNRLYLNKGNYRFEDVTERAGVGGPPGWKTGVTMADVNGDCRLDIYVSAVW